jgi:hypothetical protein
VVRYCIALEKEGIPTVAMVGPGFMTISKTIGKFEGIPDLRVTGRVIFGSSRFAWETFSHEDLVEEIVQAFARPVVSNAATAKSGSAPKEDFLSFAGENVGQVIETVDREFYKRHWTDGLPIIPPTEERIQWMLRGTDLPPDHLVGILEPQKGLATVRTIAINAVMAGARPEYLPVILAMVEAIADPNFFFAGAQATGNTGAEMVIISGPIAKALDVHSGFGLLGACWYPNFRIGRTLRLLSINVGGAWPGINRMSTYKTPGSCGSWVFSEAVDLLPKGWDPLHVDMGYAPEKSTVSLMFLQEYTSAGESTCSIEQFVDIMKRNGGLSSYKLNSDCLLIICPPCAEYMAGQGYTKDSIRKEVFEKVHVPIKAEKGHQRHMESLPKWIQEKKVGELAPMHLEKPEDLVIAVAGGTAFYPYYGLFFSSHGAGERLVTKEIDKYLPKNWEGLLKEGNADQ